MSKQGLRQLREPAEGGDRAKLEAELQELEVRMRHLNAADAEIADWDAQLSRTGGTVPSLHLHGDGESHLYPHLRTSLGRAVSHSSAPHGPYLIGSFISC